MAGTGRGPRSEHSAFPRRGQNRDGETERERKKEREKERGGER